ncbi:MULTISPECIES: cupin domain-containing protein [unclassified Inquilinus]|uniref:cupin domain-containing protein n=1 Tax=unclassified Inquilinus TaxID=2645927 RepID=UPI003F92CE66
MTDTRAAVPGASNRDAALKALYDDVFNKNMFPFWASSVDVAHDEIKQLMGTQKALPFLWSYDKDIAPILQRSAELIHMDDSERRSLILVNPGLSPRRATVSTMYTAYRLNDPNEVMPPHRHSPSAIRFGLTGKSNFTGVEGEDITFGPGDMVLTPIDAWHNHGNTGDEPAVNLSVLDLPLVETLNAVYFEHDYAESGVAKKVQSARFPSDYSARVYGAGGLRPRFLDHHRGSGLSSPMYVYRWDAMREALERFKDWDGDPYEALMIEYVDPLTGGPVFKTITFFAQMLRPGERTRPLRQTASLLVAPFQGSGHSMVDGKRFDWTEFDTLAVPGGSWCEHVNGSETEPAILFVASDEPALKAFSLFRKWGRDASGDVVRMI